MKYRKSLQLIRLTFLKRSTPQKKATCMETRAGEPEPDVFGSLEKVPLKKKKRSRSRLEKKSGAGAGKN